MLKAFSQDIIIEKNLYVEEKIGKNKNNLKNSDKL